MKRFLTLIFLLAGITLAQAQTTAFDVNGIKVIFKPTLKNVIDVRLYFRGGVTNYPTGQSGIEDVALYAATECGTKKFTANALRDTADKYGVVINGRSYYDYGYLQLNCISQYFNKGWGIFTDVVLNPVFDAGELNLLKNKLTASLRSAQANPNTHLAAVEMRNAFAGTPYKTDPHGTEETVNGFTPDDLKAYYQTILNKNRMFIVVVGNISKQELYEKILLAFDHIRSQPYTTPELSTPTFNDNKLIVEQRDLKTNYVSAVMNAPDFASNDYVPFRLAVSGLGGNLYANLHSQRSLSYDPTAGTFPYRMPYTTMSASSNSPQQVMYAMVNTLKGIQRNGYNEEWLQHIKNSYITNNYVNDQSSSQLTFNLGLAEILGNWHYADDLPQLVNMVTVEQVNKAINAYIIGFRWNYVGNTDIIEGFKPPGF